MVFLSMPVLQGIRRFNTLKESMPLKDYQFRVYEHGVELHSTGTTFVFGWVNASTSGSKYCFPSGYQTTYLTPAPNFIVPGAAIISNLWVYANPHDYANPLHICIAKNGTNTSLDTNFVQAGGLKSDLYHLVDVKEGDKIGIKFNPAGAGSGYSGAYWSFRITAIDI